MAQVQDTSGSGVLEEVLECDGEFLRRLVQGLVQEILEAEMSEHLQVGRYERTGERRGYRSGHYSRNLVTRVGTLELRIPQDRQGRFSTEVFERYQRSEIALVSALAEMYVQGVSTRKVKAITEELCGHSFSVSSISRMNKRLDGELSRFARRPLEECYPYVILDARYERVREDGVVRSRAVLIAVGVNADGRRWSSEVDLGDTTGGVVAVLLCALPEERVGLSSSQRVGRLLDGASLVV